LKIEKVRKLVEEYQEYINLYENYQPQNMQQEAIKLYAELGTVDKVAKELNTRGFRKPGRKGELIKLESNDVTEMIIKKPDNDPFHEAVRKTLNRNRGKRGLR
jgi:hypothetical protein